MRLFRLNHRLDTVLHLLLHHLLVHPRVKRCHQGRTGHAVGHGDVLQLDACGEARAYLQAAVARAASGEVLEWHVFSGTALCGSIRLKDIDTADRNARIGYYLGQQFQGRGIASAAVRAVLAHAFGAQQLHRIELQCAASNHASMALAGRLGFAHEGVLRQAECLNGVFVDLHVYGLLQADFRPD